jgi:hypothetical protein
MGNSRQSVICSDVGFTLNDGRSQPTVAFSEVKNIQGVKLDKLTYEENFLRFSTAQGTRADVGELAAGFTVLESRLTAFFDGFPLDWRTRLEEGPSGEFQFLWPRE